jgi:two-component sensor histidine kinase
LSCSLFQNCSKPKPLHGEADQFKLSISDNGIGLPPGINPQKSASLGMSLMRGLSRQLKENFDLKSEGGLSIVVVFEKEYILNPHSIGT